MTKLLLNLKDLQEMLGGIGRNLALTVGKESGAAIKCGRRTLYRTDVITEYVKTHSVLTSGVKTNK